MFFFNTKFNIMWWMELNSSNVNDVLDELEIFET